MRKKFFLKTIMVIAAGLGAAGAAAAQNYDRGRETGIDFAANGGIRDWHAPNDREIYIMDRMGRWYHAELGGRCINLPYLRTVQFETDAAGRFDSFSLINTEYGSCQVESLVRSERPAAKGGKKRRG